MSFIHVQFAPGFGYEDVVLLAMDTPGVKVVLKALKDALQGGQARFECDGVVQEFRIQAGAADIELSDDLVVWQLDCARAVEVEEYLASFRESDRPGHQYVDIHSPTETLVLSHDEYTRQYFEQLPGELRYAKPGESSV
ncbi:hypothetical protein [Mycobacterium aquaticum]|uniref:Uncharacterized protein n=1 Tax=Mycobacterium aquaticum TaxID=1927124 RepID=A0A1X0AXQ9_9MYCO|nr:hypothetical protein [Mycobacterium aquaticum]ORA34877.1 hypothetical protein BST13_15685 [Mycobacterium aquaticum]